MHGEWAINLLYMMLGRFYLLNSMHEHIVIIIKRMYNFRRHIYFLLFKIFACPAQSSLCALPGNEPVMESNRSYSLWVILLTCRKLNIPIWFSTFSIWGPIPFTSFKSSGVPVAESKVPIESNKEETFSRLASASHIGGFSPVSVPLIWFAILI